MNQEDQQQICNIVLKATAALFDNQILALIAFLQVFKSYRYSFKVKLIVELNVIHVFVATCSYFFYDFTYLLSFWEKLKLSKYYMRYKEYIVLFGSIIILPDLYTFIR